MSVLAIHRRVSAALVSAALVAALPASLVPPSSAVDSGIEEGTPLPALPESELTVAPLWGGAAGYVMHDRRQAAEGDPTVLTVARLPDGEVARTFTLGSRDSDPHLVGSSVVQEHFAGWSGPIDGVEVTDLETGKTRLLTVASGQTLVRGDEDWALVHTHEDSPTPETGESRLQLVRPDGSVTNVAGPLVHAPVTYVGGDAQHAYLRDGEGPDRRVFHVDVAAGHVIEVPAPSGGWGEVHVTPGRVVSRTQAADPTTGDSLTRLSWQSRTSAGSGVVDAPAPAAGARWFPFGDRMALLDQDGRLLPVDFAEGGYDAPVATGVRDVQDLGDGRLALARTDRPSGSVAVVADDGAGPRHVAALPTIARRAVAPELNGDWVRSDFDGPGPTPQVARSDGSAAWQEDVSPFATSGDVTLTTTAPDGEGHYVSRLSWPGGSRDLADVTPMLGHGGLLVAVPVTRDGLALWEIQDVRTGAVLEERPRDPLRPIALDGPWVWTIPDEDGVMRGVDTSGAHGDMRVRTGVRCFPDQTFPRYFDVRGRFALYTCEQDRRFYVSDTHEVVPWWSVTTPPGTSPKLGDELLLAPRIVTEADGYTKTAMLDAYELTEQHAQRSYGPLRGAVHPGRISFDVDEADTRRAVYVDRFGLPRMVDLGWVASAPTTRPDVTAPALAAEPDVPSLVAAQEPRSVTWAWDFRDEGTELEPASGVHSLDVRRRSQTGADSYGAWTTPADLQGLTTASVTVSVAPGSGACLSARARDGAGNVTAWSAPRCSFVDGGAPRLGSVRAAPRVVAHTGGTMAFAYLATDDHRVASYDVAHRVARRGEARYGAWRTTRTARTRLSVDVSPGSDWCLRFRARDDLGQVSPWSGPVCRAVPLDDRSYLRLGDAVQRRSKLAIERTYTELTRPGASITFARQAGRAAVLSVLRGPGQGPADVYFANRRLGRIRLAAPTTRRAFVTLRLPARSTGTVRVVQVGRGRVRVDAVAMLR